MKVIDYLQQEMDAAEAQQEATKARKDGKHARCAELAKALAKTEPASMGDRLDVFGD